MKELRLDTRIAIHHDQDGVASEPHWVGTIEEYCEANADTLTYRDIRDMIADLTAAESGNQHHMGGGAAGQFTIRLADENVGRVA